MDPLPIPGFLVLSGFGIPEGMAVTQQRNDNLESAPSLPSKIKKKAKAAKNPNKTCGLFPDLLIHSIPGKALTAGISSGISHLSESSGIHRQHSQTGALWDNSPPKNWEGEIPPVCCF